MQPNQDEEKQHYINRFMCDANMSRQYTDKDARLAVCHYHWAKHHKHQYDMAEGVAGCGSNSYVPTTEDKKDKRK